MANLNSCRNDFITAANSEREPARGHRDGEKLKPQPITPPNLLRASNNHQSAAVSSHSVQVERVASIAFANKTNKAALGRGQNNPSYRANTPFVPPPSVSIDSPLITHGPRIVVPQPIDSFPSSRYHPFNPSQSCRRDRRSFGDLNQRNATNTAHTTHISKLLVCRLTDTSIPPHHPEPFYHHKYRDLRSRLVPGHPAPRLSPLCIDRSASLYSKLPLCETFLTSREFAPSPLATGSSINLSGRQSTTSGVISAVNASLSSPLHCHSRHPLPWQLLDSHPISHLPSETEYSSTRQAQTHFRPEISY